MNRKHRSAFAKFRCGVAPLKIETGRYTNLHLEERVCFNCHTEIEDEMHVLINCPLYTCEREELFLIASYINPCFNLFSDVEKLNFLLSDADISKRCAKACHEILEKRRDILYK